jgi:hypothetical protein
MAKRGRRRTTLLNTTAEGIGRSLGKLANRLDAWRKQRDELAQDLRHVVGAGERMLLELGHGAQVEGSKALRATAKAVKSGRRKGFKMSAAARRKISLAAKKRWAAKRAGQS